METLPAASSLEDLHVVYGDFVQSVYRFEPDSEDEDGGFIIAKPVCDLPQIRNLTVSLSSNSSYGDVLGENFHFSNVDVFTIF